MNQETRGGRELTLEDIPHAAVLVRVDGDTGGLAEAALLLTLLGLLGGRVMNVADGAEQLAVLWWATVDSVRHEDQED